MVKKLKMFLMLAVSLAVLVFPMSASAVGWSYNLKQDDHWGSSNVQTAYPKLACTITNEVGQAYAVIQVLDNGQWKTALYQTPETPTLGPGWHQVTIKAPASSSKVYRVYVWTLASGARGGVSCKGVWN